MLVVDYRTLFSSEEWDTLRAAPFNVQVLVSQADDERELDEIGPLLDILISYDGDPFVKEVFRDSLEATEETRLIKDTRDALNEVSSAVNLIKKNIETNGLGEDTLDIFCAQLLEIAEQTATADLEGLEKEEESIINLLKKKFS
tara:strand:- start:64 stop:495 length:432 start_codon:yes stop_codon:yes gene_type:complete